MKTFLLALATITTGLIAGVYYAFSVSVNPAFAGLPDAAYFDAMNRIKVAIVNRAFSLSFFGAPLLLPVVTWMYARPAFSRKAGYLLAASLIFWIGSLGITVAGNIPLNEKLASFVVNGATAEQAAAARKAFAGAWNNWHAVRTWASIIALVLTVMACLTRDAPVQTAKR